MIHAVVFDLDGTLLDTIPDIAGALNRALAACGLPTHPVRRVETFVGGGIRDAVRKAVPADTPGETLERILEIYKEDYCNRCTEQTARYPGVPEMLERLLQHGFALGVLSNKTEATAQKIVRTYFPDVPFRCVLGRVDGRPLKPDPAAAVPVLEALGLPAGEVAYAGDSGTDILFAKAVGMVPAAAPWGYRSRDELVEKGALLVPENPRELGELLAALG
ncbi:MAG: HAD family hydrolase [Oscillospiraceae bacterium]|jgi:phosphoglycolate phosphatase|nr:HAD family hydrolase [Oscillospiraceae bacterium]